MTLVTGTVQDLGYDGMDGTLWARPARFRSDGSVVLAPERKPFKITGGVVSAELAPGPAVLELQVGSHARGTFEVVIPDTDTTLADLLDTVFPWEPAQVSLFVAERLAAEAAAGAAAASALQTGQDRTAVAQDRVAVEDTRDLLDAAYDQSQAGMTLPPRLMESALNATYGTKAEVQSLDADKLDKAEAVETFRPRTGSLRVVFLGDSITIGNSTTTGNVQNRTAYPTFAMLNSGGRWLFGANAGIGGNTSTQMLARFQTDVVDAGADVVVIMAGMNDSGFSVVLPTYAGNITAMADAAEAAGITPVFAAVTASIAGGTRGSFITRYNEWLRRFCGSRGYLFIDTYALTADPATGGLLAAYDSSDAVHPNVAGCEAIGELVAAELSKVFPSQVQTLIASANHTYDCLAGSGMFLTDADGNGIGDGWGPYNNNNPGGTSFARVSDPQVKGMMQRVKPVGTTAGIYASRTFAAGTWAIGDRIALSGVISSDAGTPALAQVLFTGSTGPYTLYRPVEVQRVIERGRIYGEVVIPSGTTEVTLMMGATVGGTANHDFGQVAAINLTRMGIAA